MYLTGKEAPVLLYANPTISILAKIGTPNMTILSQYIAIVLRAGLWSFHSNT